ncbi:Pectinesterase inhibitor domain [Dillenia turbinata]|uniref:Pectinesterase inhibitor domain n=1 Tax=Dillenia turbinata TaxID=194707 RepID=A0AAN8YZW2_9MAGN
MSSNPYTLSFLFFFFVFFISPSLASFFNLHDSRHNLQFYTLPSFCKSLFPNNASANIHDYGRFPLSQSLKSATKFHSLVNWYLRFKFIYPTQVVNALQDCQLLAELNIDFLSNTAKSTDPTDTLYGVEAQDSHTLLSAILKNQETCSYGLELASATAASIKNALLVPFVNGTKLYSISLALFPWGCIHKAKGGQWLTERDEEIYKPIRVGVNAALSKDSESDGSGESLTTKRHARAPSLLPAGNTSDPKELIKAAFKVTEKKISEGLQQSSVLQELEKGSKSVGRPWLPARELMNSTIDDLKRVFQPLRII